MLAILKALHEHTAYAVKMHGDVSEKWTPDRGLREGCPSSLVLFNMYHDGVMKDFRAQREAEAKEKGLHPGSKMALQGGRAFA